MNFGKIILSLYDRSGVWSQPYADAGYDVRRIDIQDGMDARLLTYTDRIHGLILQPPCTEFALSGARWWGTKKEDALIAALALVDAGLRWAAVHARTLKWWVMENPIGRLQNYVGPPAHTIHPWEYDAYTDEDDNYTKATCLWGNFTLPPPKPGAEPHDKTRILHVSTGPARANTRSRTPAGWAQAFFEANP